MALQLEEDNLRPDNDGVEVSADVYRSVNNENKDNFDFMILNKYETNELS